MAVKVHEEAFEQAKQLIKDGKFTKDERDNWSEHAPSTDDENKFIEDNGMEAFGKWYLGIDPDEEKENKGAYSFPYGDFKEVHRGAVIAEKVRAGQYDHSDLEKAADTLLQMIDESD